MRENYSLLPEEVYLHERGGLTPAHWEEVVKRISNPRSKTAQKIIAYAQKVISGDFPDTGFHHRQYLGRRHWDLIVSLDTRDKVKTHRKFPPWPKITFVYNHLVQAAGRYAQLEESASYTLDDYVAEELSGAGLKDRFEIQLNEYYFIRWTGNTWNKYELEMELRPDHSGPMGFRTEIPLGIAEENTVLSVWLLTKGDILDPVHTTPHQLKDKLREQAKLNPDEIRNRLKVRREYLFIHENPKFESPSFGILEEEIK